MERCYDNSFYANRPRSHKEQEAILKFLELEAECDRYNINQYESCDLSHMSRTKQGDLNRSINGRDGWLNINSKNIKHYKSTRPFSINRERTWYES